MNMQVFIRADPFQNPQTIALPCNGMECFAGANRYRVRLEVEDIEITLSNTRAAPGVPSKAIRIGATVWL